MAFTKTAGVEYGTPAVVLSTTAAAGSNQTAIRTDGQLIAFSTDAPEDIAYGQSAATGSDAVAARLDHDHGMAASTALDQASQAEVEGETDVDKYVPPDMLKYSPGVAKTWCKWAGGSTTIEASYNVTSVSDDGTGDSTVTVGDDFSGTEWVAYGGFDEASGGQIVILGAQAAGTQRVLCKNLAGTLSARDPASFYFSGFGDQ